MTKRKRICTGLLLLLLVTGIFAFNVGRRDKEPETVRQEIPAQKQEAGITEEENPDKQNEQKTEEKAGCKIVEAEALTAVEDWSVAGESFVIEDETGENKTPELCGISEKNIYFDYAIYGEGMALEYCVFDRESGETKKLHELEVRDVVFPAVFYDEHMYILDVRVPDYQIWDISADGVELFASGKCVYYPELQLIGSRLTIRLYQKTESGVTCILSWADLRSEESGVVQISKYRENIDGGNVSGTEISNAGGWGDGIIYETFSYDREPRNTYNRGGRDYGEQELWYYDFATGETTRQELALGQHSYYVGGNEDCIVIDRASINEPLPNSGTIYERTADGYVSRKIPGIDATNSIERMSKMADGQILLDCMEGFLLIDMNRSVCTGEETYNFTYSDKEVAFVDEAGVVHVRKYAD